MLLILEKSLCSVKQRTIVSKDKGASPEHRAYNTGDYDVRHYRLDGDLVKQQKCCDFLVLNDSMKKAYFIELKGGKIDEAIPQLENGVKLCEAELKGYTFYYRIVSSKVKTQKLESNRFRKFKEKCGSNLRYRTEYMEENI